MDAKKSPRPKLERKTSSNEGSSDSGSIEKRWSKTLTRPGWVGFPTVILERQLELGLDAVDVNIILHLAKHWFVAGDLPRPSKKSIARAMGMTPRAIQKRLAKLEERDYVHRLLRRGEKGVKATQTSEYSFAGLITAAKPHAREVMARREEAKRVRESRARRGAAGSGEAAE